MAYEGKVVEDDGHGGGGELDRVVQEKENEVKALDGEKLDVGSVLESGTEVEGMESSVGISEEVVEKESTEDGERGVGDSSVVAGKTQVVATGEVEEAREGGLKGELMENDSGRDECKEYPVLADEVKNAVVDSGVKSSLAVVGSSGGETQVVLDKASLLVVESSSKSTVDVNSDLEKQKDCISDGAVLLNPEVETLVARSATIVKSVTIDTKCSQEAPDIVNGEDLSTEAKPESLDIQTQPDVEEEVSGKDNGNSVRSEAEAIQTDACDEGSVDKLDSYVEVGGGSIEAHDNALGDTIPSCQPTEGEGENPEVLSDSVEDKQLKLEESLAEGSDHDLGQVKADIAEQMEVDTQFIDAKKISVCGEHEIEAEHMDCKADIVCRDNNLDTTTSDRKQEGCASNNKEETINAKVNDLVAVAKDHQLKLEKFEDKIVASDFAQLDSCIGKETEVQDQTTDANKVNAHPVSEGNENNVDDCTDPVSLCQSAQLNVEGDVAAMDVDFLSDQNLEIQDPVGLDEVSPCSKNDQILKTETVCQSTEMDNQVSDEMEMATLSSEVMNDNIVTKEMVAESQVTDAEQILEGGREVEFEERGSEKPNEQKSTKQAAQEAGNSAQQAHYELPMETECEFSVSELVWGKVRSHPWWPGQIFDPSDASEKAMKYQKKGCFLVAYFGDKTFAWNDASLLKPFCMHFSQIEKQGNSEAFQNAVQCALVEVSRRVELGLACSCIINDVYDSIKFQVVENAGIRQESSTRDGVDESASACAFEPGKLVEYVKALAQSPSAGADRLELVVAKAQLLAFCRFKGFSLLPELEDSEETSFSEGQSHLGDAVGYPNPVSEEQRIAETKKSASHKRKHNLRDMYPMKKERSLSELMEGTLDFPDGENGSDEKATSKLVSPIAAKKRKTFDSLVNDTVTQDGGKSISLAKVSNTTSRRQSFKIGECIQRAATHLSGPSSIIKCNSDKAVVDGFGVSLEDLEDTQGESEILLDELLSQLHLAAQNPFHGHSFSNIIVSFFSDFRDSVVPSQSSIMEKRGGKRKTPSLSIPGFPETFEFVDMNDSYWTDMVVQNGSLEQLAHKGRMMPVALEPDKSVKSSRGPYSRKRYRDVNSELEAEAEAQALMDLKRRASPAEIIMTFSTMNYVPSETSLNKMFKRFGPLKESETMLDRETCRARVVYKKGSDAEVAYSSAGKFNIFGPLVVTYQLNFSPFEPFKALYTPSIEGLEEATLYLQSQS